MAEEAVEFPLRNQTELGNALIDLVLAGGLRDDIVAVMLRSPLGQDYPEESSIRWVILGILENYVDGGRRATIVYGEAILVADVIALVAAEDLHRLQEFRQAG